MKLMLPLLFSLSWAQQATKSNLQFMKRLCNLLGQHILSSLATQWPLWFTFSTSQPSPGPQRLHIQPWMTGYFLFVLHASSQISISDPQLCICAWFSGGGFLCLYNKNPHVFFLLMQPVWQYYRLQEEGNVITSEPWCPVSTAQPPEKPAHHRQPMTVQITARAAISPTHGRVRDYSSKWLPPLRNGASMQHSLVVKQTHFTFMFFCFNLILKHITKSVCKYSYSLN